MTTLDNPFAGLTAMRDLLRSEPEPAAVAASPVPGENPFATLNQPPPFAPATPPPLTEPACGGTPITDVSEEVSALPVDAPEPVPATEPAVEDSKPKRRPGRPRKKPAEDAAATEEPKDRVAYLRGIAATESPASAFAKLTDEVSTLESARNDLVSRVESVTSRIAESDASRIRVTAQIEELTKFLDTLNEQVAPLREELADKSSEVASVEEELAVATESLGRVRDFIVALSGGNPGIVGGVRVTVLDGITHVETL